MPSDGPTLLRLVVWLARSDRHASGSALHGHPCGKGLPFHRLVGPASPHLLQRCVPSESLLHRIPTVSSRDSFFVPSTQFCGTDLRASAPSQHACTALDPSCTFCLWLSSNISTEVSGLCRSSFHLIPPPLASIASTGVESFHHRDCRVSQLCERASTRGTFRRLRSARGVRALRRRSQTSVPIHRGCVRSGWFRCDVRSRGIWWTCSSAT